MALQYRDLGPGDKIVYDDITGIASAIRLKGQMADKPLAFTPAQIAALVLLAPATGIPFASLGTAAAAGNGALRWADLGTGVPPVLLRSDGTYWRPVFPSVIARKTTLTTGLLQTGDQIIGQLGPLPAGLLYPGAVFGLRFGVGRDVNTDAYGTMTIRIGTAGTTGDTSVTSISLSAPLPAAGGLSTGIENWSVMLTATSCARAGLGNGSSSFTGSTSSGLAMLAATPISDVTANALYFSVSTTMATAAASKPQTGFMELILEP